jgi:hypothetical protein
VPNRIGAIFVAIDTTALNLDPGLRRNFCDRVGDVLDSVQARQGLTSLHPAVLITAVVEWSPVAAQPKQYQLQKKEHKIKIQFISERRGFWQNEVNFLEF